MFSFIETILSLLTAVINACFPASCNKPPNPEKSPVPKKRRYSVTKTITATETIETIGSPIVLSGNQIITI